MPIFRRLPKRGFNNVQFRTEYQVVNLTTLEQRFQSGQTVNPEVLRQQGLVHGADPLVKILGSGTLTKKLVVEAHAFSGSAQQAIENAGGQVRLIERIDPAQKAKAKRGSAKKRPADAGQVPQGAGG